MAWASLGEFDLNKNWQFTAPVKGELFRISHKLVRLETFDKKLARGVLAQGFDDGRVTIFKSKLFNYKEEDELLALYYPQGLDERSLCFKRFDDSADNWSIFVEVFQGSAEQNLSNYLTARFGETTVNMALYPLLYGGNIAPTSLERLLNSNRPIKILDENESRTKVRIFSSGHPVLLATGFDQEGKPLDIISKLPPNYKFEEVISIAGMYKGDIYALSADNTRILVIEFSAK